MNAKTENVWNEEDEELFESELDEPLLVGGN